MSAATELWPAPSLKGLPFRAAHRLDAVPEESRWLIRGLWGAEAVGIVGGEPKCCKSFLALDMCVSVASGAPCLGRFEPAQTGRALLYAAEDSLHIVRRRLERIALAAGTALEHLDIQVITAPTMRLDVTDDRDRLTETVRALSPRLLVLDPFVRLHRIDENASGEVAPLLGYLRNLQRNFNVAVALVHHARKGGGRARAGQALRGSSEFHAWGDSNLYLRRHGEDLTLTIEHRAAPSAAGVAVALADDGAALALRVIERPVPSTEAAPPTTAATALPKVEQALAGATAPMSLTALRAACRIRNQHVSDALATLIAEGRVRKTAAGYLVASR
jgi:hypothetical protein